MILNNPYLYHPHPLCKVAAGDLCSVIDQHPDWKRELSKGKMLGILVVKGTREHYINKEYSYIAAYSGIVNINHEGFFVPPIYDLNNPDDFYKEEEKNISAINETLTNTSLSPKEIQSLKAERKERSQALQLKIFQHFNFLNQKGEEKNIVEIFSEAKRGLPPGGTGECAAPRLLQYAFSNGLEPVAMAEFWYGIAPRLEVRLHKEFYPSCIDKCSPILKYMLCEGKNEDDRQCALTQPTILYEDADIIVLDKPAEVLSTPAKDTSLFNVETWLHETHPEVKGPMLVHRLDQSTSGLMIAAKNSASFKILQQGFLDHSIRKMYLAWVEGTITSDCGVINLPICPNPDDRPRQTVDHKFGKQAITRYKVLKRENNRTLLALYPFTGRTHQLRMHCASPFGLDAPIVGDRLYTIEQEKLSEKRLMLQATEITFVHPTTKEVIKKSLPHFAN